MMILVAALLLFGVVLGAVAHAPLSFTLVAAAVIAALARRLRDPRAPRPPSQHVRNCTRAPARRREPTTCQPVQTHSREPTTSWNSPQRPPPGDAPAPPTRRTARPGRRRHGRRLLHARSSRPARHEHLPRPDRHRAGRRGPLARHDPPGPRLPGPGTRAWPDLLVLVAFMQLDSTRVLELLSADRGARAAAPRGRAAGARRIGRTMAYLDHAATTPMLPEAVRR